MARDRKRAKQRQRQRQRRGAPQREGAGDAFAQRSEASEREPLEADPLEHASAEVDLAEAALADPPQAELRPDELPAPDELQEPDAEGAAEVETVRGGDGAGAVAAPRGRRAGAELPSEGNRFVNFLRACAAELRRVQWPDRRQVTQATGVVLGFVIIAGAYLGLLDAVFSRLVNAIL